MMHPSNSSLEIFLLRKLNDFPVVSDHLRLPQRPQGLIQLSEPWLLEITASKDEGVRLSDVNPE